jgi:capsular exopolysaccharide synthesis family protein
MITSAVAKEGKTLTACNVGITIAQGLEGEAILLDCDLRKPTVDQYFGFHGRPGLTELLMGTTDLASVVHPVEGSKLKVIPAGRVSDSPAELLSSEKMGQVLEELKARYEGHHIIVDTTPILLTAETAVLSRLVGGILFVIMAGKTSRDMVKQALKEIDRDKLIGVVLNNTEPVGTYHYGYEYSRYYHSRRSGIGKRIKRLIS